MPTLSRFAVAQRLYRPNVHALAIIPLCLPLASPAEEGRESMAGHEPTANPVTGPVDPILCACLSSEDARTSDSVLNSGGIEA